MTWRYILAAALTCTTLAPLGCKKETVKDPRTLPELVRLVSASGSGAGEQSFTGAVTARVQSDLGFRVAGKVTQRLVDAGQSVRIGQPLMRIDITDYTHAITTQTQNVAAAKAHAEQASADEVRYRGLVSTGAVSASAYDQVKAAADSAQAQLAAAQAQEKIARDNGDYSLLLADANGIVIDTLAEPGQVVAAGQTVVKLAHSGPREAAVFLPETLRPTLGSTVHASLYGGRESTTAKLRQLSDSADPLTRTYEARYVLQGADANAPLGATVTIQFPSAIQTSANVSVPNSAIFDRGSGPGVWIVNRTASTVSFRSVTIARLGQDDAYLSSGLHPGEQVVALGAHLLTEGQQVRIAEKEMASR